MIRRLAKRLGRAPTMVEYDESRGVGLAKALAIRGCWKHVLEKAGVRPPK